MKLIQDRKRLRRAYLRKKITAYLSLVGSRICYALILIACFLGFGFLGLNTLGNNKSWLMLPVFAVGFVVVFYITLCLAELALDWRYKAEQATKTPHVPPVTPDTLPADEVLVRSSAEPPVVQSKVLLRAAKGVETPTEELLRVEEQ